jgi:carboxylesterase type B
MYGPGEDMDANVGLFDCLAAAEWTSKYIHKFGGDASRVTAMGESAGASILYYMSTLGGGKAKLPFQQMFIASPASPPRRNVDARQSDSFKTVLEAANCSSIGCLRSLSEDDLKKLNHRVINDTDTESGGGNFGPGIGFAVMPDGKDLPDIPLQIFRDGKVNKGLKRVIVGSMANEGLTTSSDADMPARFPSLVRRMLPNASDETIAKIQTQYHPKVPEQLAWDWVTDVVYACQSYNLANGLADRARLFMNSFPPAFHGQDISCKLILPLF